MIRENESLCKPTLWDGKTLPYIPSAPVVLGSFVTHDPDRMRVVVPDVEGKYHSLTPTVRYVERQLMPFALPDCSVTNPSTKSCGVQVNWMDLPLPQGDGADRFLPPSLRSTIRRNLNPHAEDRDSGAM